jgi:hypothetical protein
VNVPDARVYAGQRVGVSSIQLFKHEADAICIFISLSLSAPPAPILVRTATIQLRISHPPVS